MSLKLLYSLGSNRAARGRLRTQEFYGRLFVKFQTCCASDRLVPLLSFLVRDRCQSIRQRRAQGEYTS